MKKKLLVVCTTALCTFSLLAQDTAWPPVTAEARPGSRWWWMGSAVDAANLTSNLEAYAKAGMGTMEITPIYGVQGNEAHEVSYLSPQWMQLLRHTESEAARLGMKIDMNNGTGWPFGGPEVTIEDAACKLITETYAVQGGERLKTKIIPSDIKQQAVAKLQRLMAYSSDKCVDLTSKVDSDGMLNWKAPRGGEWHLIAAFCGKTFQQVKRAAPGGAGWVMNHFSSKAVANYLQRFERAFAQTDTPYPHNFFNDSYEVYGADWTDDLFEQFERRRGYKLENHLPEFLTKERKDATRRIVSDYRETLGELLQENFTRQWTDWAHRHHAQTRNQAHGSPGNLIDLYATVDIPECEGFGLSNFHIKGLRTDTPYIRKNDSDLSMLKYASSGAHIAGKPYTSSETFTWLTEHFRTSLSQCKPDVDLMFVSGVNHVYFHGTTYSPKEAAWPGWKFYASMDMSPTNNIWRDAPAFFDYITRCQSFLQMGKPDNDFLVYLPVYDMWNEQRGRLLQFTIHSMESRAPRFIEAVHRINNAGYDMDYISDSFIRTATCRNGKIYTSGGTAYSGLVIPAARLMPADVLQKLLTLANEGAKIVFLEHYPEDVPGFLRMGSDAFKQVLAQLQALAGKGHVFFGSDYAATLAATGVIPEAMKANYGLSAIRRINKDGNHYFISALKADGVSAWVPLAVEAASAVFYNPMNGTSGLAPLRQHNGRTEVYLELASGESIILKTFRTALPDNVLPPYPMVSGSVNDLKSFSWLPGDYKQQWGFQFLSATPSVTDVPDSVALGSWTELPSEGVKNTMGTARYTTTFTVANPAEAADWLLDLGDVRESARIRINGQAVATLFAVPFRCLVGRYIRQGNNLLEIEVTNLPANRIAQMDREGIVWRKFKDTNIVNIHYKKENYGKWTPVPSGLLGPVTLVPIEK
ncbi:MAG: glycosyl hydrolase family 2 [Prevotellaceae bacterium]|jgi:hypothetical protein|nr:glycosyl hydrolase family 2 [Prevotellaceae bacterium]